MRCLTTILGAESLGSKMMSKKQVERGCGYMLLLGFASRQVKKAGRLGRSEDQNRRWCGGDRESKSFGLVVMKVHATIPSRRWGNLENSRGFPCGIGNGRRAVAADAQVYFSLPIGCMYGIGKNGQLLFVKNFHAAAASLQPQIRSW